MKFWTKTNEGKQEMEVIFDILAKGHALKIS